MSRQPILILSADAFAAALLGAAVELGGGVPRFAEAGEPPRDAIRRVRPRVLVVDCDDERACDEAVLGPALMTGARVILFRSPRSRVDTPALASASGVTLLAMPRDLERLVALVAEDALPA